MRQICDCSGECGYHRAVRETDRTEDKLARMWAKAQEARREARAALQTHLEDLARKAA